jgi:hypothetical protein
MSVCILIVVLTPPCKSEGWRDVARTLATTNGLLFVCLLSYHMHTVSTRLSTYGADLHSVVIAFESLSKNKPF